MEHEQYKYYSTRRPVDLGTFPKPPGNAPVEIINYDVRQWMERDTILAWGELTYTKPLTEEEMSSYELRPSRHNPDVRRMMYEQAQVVGAWEVRNHIPETKRLTWWHPDFGNYVTGDCVTPEQLASRYKSALEHPKLSRGSAKQRKPTHRENR